MSGSHDGLTVTITPLESAFFAGELFTASVTFTNSAPRVAPPSLHSLHSLSKAQSHLQQQRDANWRPSKPPTNRKRPPSASQFGLADYSTHALDSDQVPPSPFFRSRDSGSFSTLPPEHDDQQLLSYTRTVSTNSAGHSRSLSTANSPVASTSKLPIRKGLIGTQIYEHERRASIVVGGGLYPGGPRRPGVLQHSRSQSLAVQSSSSLSTPDLHDGSDHRSVSSRSIAKSRLASGPHALDQLRTNGSGSGSYTPQQGEERPSVGSRYPSAQSEALSSTFSLESDQSDTVNDPTQSVTSLHPFYGTGQNETMESVLRENVDQWAKQDNLRTPRPPGAFTAATRSASSPATTNPNRFSFSRAPSYGTDVLEGTYLSPPGTINLLWSFAHLEGSFEVDPALVKPGEFVDVKKQLIGAYGTGVGGGTLQKKDTSGWRGWLWGGAGQQTRDESATTAASLEERRVLTMKDKTVPIWSNPPSILGVDVVLEPGESKTYNFSVRIPADLPPSFRGKSVKFTYHFVVGTNRAQLGSKYDAGPSVSRTMRIPIRVYNNVAVSGARPFYDLTNPVITQRDEATVTDAEEDLPLVLVQKRVKPHDRDKADFETFATSLLGSVLLASPGHDGAVNLSPQPRHLASPPMPSRPKMQSRTSNLSVNGDPGMPEDCRSAIEIVSSASQKASFDINKDGYMVARLTLVKLAYRLGETVNGSVLVNSAEGRVLRVSVRLETHEQIETTISVKSAAQVRASTARLHSEHHEMTLDSARIGFALAIPSGATPDFATSGVKLQWSVRLSFLVLPPSSSTPTPPPAGSKTLKKPIAPANGQPPDGRPASHARSKSLAHGFQPAIALTLPETPAALPTGAAHLMPVVPSSTDSRRSFPPPAHVQNGGSSTPNHTTYRAVPDLGFVPVLFASATPEPPPLPGPLQRSASGHKRDASLPVLAAQRPPSGPPSNVVLVPAKVDTIECSIPIKVYPGNTAFRPTVTIFDC